MKQKNQFNQRNKIDLKFKSKLIVFYSCSKDKNLLSKLSNKCKTCDCQYSLILVDINSIGNTLSKEGAKRYVKAHIQGYIKTIDKICFIKPYIDKFDEFAMFNSYKDFHKWFIKISDKCYSERKEKVQ